MCDESDGVLSDRFVKPGHAVIEVAQLVGEGGNLILKASSEFSKAVSALLMASISASTQASSMPLTITPMTNLLKSEEETIYWESFFTAGEIV